MDSHSFDLFSSTTAPTSQYPIETAKDLPVECNQIAFPCWPARTAREFEHELATKVRCGRPTKSVVPGHLELPLHPVSPAKPSILKLSNVIKNMEQTRKKRDTWPAYVTLHTDRVANAANEKISGAPPLATKNSSVNLSLQLPDPSSTRCTNSFVAAASCATSAAGAESTCAIEDEEEEPNDDEFNRIISEYHEADRVSREAFAKQRGFPGFALQKLRKEEEDCNTESAVTSDSPLSVDISEMPRKPSTMIATSCKALNGYVPGSSFLNPRTPPPLPPRQLRRVGKPIENVLEAISAPYTPRSPLGSRTLLSLDPRPARECFFKYPPVLWRKESHKRNAPGGITKMIAQDRFQSEREKRKAIAENLRALEAQEQASTNCVEVDSGNDHCNDDGTAVMAHILQDGPRPLWHRRHAPPLVPIFTAFTRMTLTGKPSISVSVAEQSLASETDAPVNWALGGPCLRTQVEEDAVCEYLDRAHNELVANLDDVLDVEGLSNLSDELYLRSDSPGVLHCDASDTDEWSSSNYSCSYYSSLYSPSPGAYFEDEPWRFVQSPDRFDCSSEPSVLSDVSLYSLDRRFRYYHLSEDDISQSLQLSRSRVQSLDFEQYLDIVRRRINGQRELDSFVASPEPSPQFTTEIATDNAEEAIAWAEEFSRRVSPPRSPRQFVYTVPTLSIEDFTAWADHFVPQVGTSIGGNGTYPAVLSSTTTLDDEGFGDWAMNISGSVGDTAIELDCTKHDRIALEMLTADNEAFYHWMDDLDGRVQCPATNNRDKVSPFPSMPTVDNEAFLTWAEEFNRRIQDSLHRQSANKSDSRTMATSQAEEVAHFTRPKSIRLTSVETAESDAQRLSPLSNIPIVENHLNVGSAGFIGQNSADEWSSMELMLIDAQSRTQRMLAEADSAMASDNDTNTLDAGPDTLAGATKVGKSAVESSGAVTSRSVISVPHDVTDFVYEGRDTIQTVLEDYGASTGAFGPWEAAITSHTDPGN